MLLPIRPCPCPRTPVNRWSRWPAPRLLMRPWPGFYVMRLRRGAPLVPALIYQLCPMAVPQPSAVDGPDPEEWCRPFDGAPHYGALIDGKPAFLDRVWMARSLRPVSRAEYAFRLGPLRQWAHANPGTPEARPEEPVDLSVLPSLF